MNFFLFTISCIFLSSISFASEIDYIKHKNFNDKLNCCNGMYVPELYNINNNDSMSIESDENLLYDQKKLGFFQKKIILNFKQYQIESDSLIYDSLKKNIYARDNVVFRDKNFILRTNKAFYDFNKNQFISDKSKIIIYPKSLRVDASSFGRNANNILIMKDASYTRCDPDDNLWKIEAKQIEFDIEKNIITIKDAYLNFKGISVFYIPYMNSSLDSQRESGFLTPGVSLSNNSENGNIFYLPFYLNLASNYDLTLYGTYFQKRGFLFSSEFRFLNKNSSGEIGLSLIKDKSEYRLLESNFRKNRYYRYLRYRINIGTNLKLDIDYNKTSDPYYFNDITDNIGYFDSDYILRKADVTFDNDLLSIDVIWKEHNLLNQSITTPYNLNPKINLSFKPIKINNFQLGADIGFANFNRNLREGYYINNDGFGENQPNHLWYDEMIYGLNRSNGFRSNFSSYLQYSFNNSYFHLIPKIKIDFVQYNLNIDKKGLDQINKINEFFEKKNKKFIPSFVLDGALKFENKMSLFGKEYNYILISKIKYRYTPYINQDQAPIFDSSEYNLDYSYLWKENRFSSVDRISDSNQISLAFENNIFNNQNQIKHKLNFGVISYFSDRKVQAPGIEYKKYFIHTDKYSPLFLNYSYNLNDKWAFKTNITRDLMNKNTTYVDGSISYRDNNFKNKFFQFSFKNQKNNLRYEDNLGIYTYNSDYGSKYLKDGSLNKDYIENYYAILNHSFSFGVPLNNNINLIGNYHYNHARKIIDSVLLALEYSTCCLSFKIGVDNYLKKKTKELNGIDKYQRENNFLLQVNLIGFGSPSQKVDKYLQNKVNGYSL